MTRRCPAGWFFTMRTTCDTRWKRVLPESCVPVQGLYNPSPRRQYKDKGDEEDDHCCRHVDCVGKRVAKLVTAVAGSPFTRRPEHAEPICQAARRLQGWPGGQGKLKPLMHDWPIFDSRRDFYSFSEMLPA